MIQKLSWLLGDDEDGDTPAWLVSLSIHVVVLLFLALLVTADPVRKDRSITVIEAPISEDDPLVDAPEEIVVSDVSTEVGSDGDASLDFAEAASLTFSDIEPVSPDYQVELPVNSSVFPTAEALDCVVTTKGLVTGVSVSGAEGVVDLLAAEIKNSLEQRPTVVCWVFDQSVSLVAQREKITARLDKVFGQINDPGLRNMVFSFGKNVNLVKTATNDTDSVVKAINDVPLDESGEEMTFHAIQAAAEKSKVFRTSNPKNNVMIVVFTDEVGNDRDSAEATSRYCRNMGVPVYVVGVPAPFGTSEAKIKYVEFDPAYQQDVTWAVVNQGPESLFPEFVRFPGDETVDSGFGPFHLSKICAETGGIYFRVHANSESRVKVTNDQTAPMASQLRRFFDPDVMGAYLPDYVAQFKLEADIKSNLAKKSLVAVASDSVVKPMDAVQTVFPRSNEGEFIGLLSSAQAVSAKVQPRLDSMCNTILAGLPDREKVKEKRWQAGYDLSLGRLLAAKVRAFTYNSMLAEAKSGLQFKNPGSDTWELVPSDRILAGSQTEKLAKQANSLLEKVVSNHSGTPWAHYAAEELRVPLGYEWVERHTGVNKKDAGGGNNNPPQARKDDEKKMLEKPKLKRDPKKI